MRRPLFFLAYFSAGLACKNLRGASWRSVGQALVLLALGVVFFWLTCIAAARVIDGVLAVPLAGPALLERLLSLLCATVFTLLLYSTIMTALSTLYASRDMELLLSSPLPLYAILVVKAAETMIRSAFMPVLFTLPFLVYLGYRTGGGAAYAIAATCTTVLFCLVPGAGGLLLCSLITAAFPRKRVQQVLTLIGVLAGAVVVIVFRLARVERLFLLPDPGAALEEWAEFLQIPFSPWLPSSWAANALAVAATGDPARAWRSIAWLTIAALFASTAYAAVARATFLTGWFKSQQSTDPRYRPRRARAGRWAGLPARFLPRDLRLIAGKDLRIFFRDMSQWAQVFMFVPLLVLYLVNVKLLPRQSQAISDLMCFLNLLLAGFLIASIAARLLFPSTSLEREAVWAVASAPISYGQFVIAKWLTFVLPIFGVALAVVGLSNLLLGVSPPLQTLSLVATAVMTLALSGLAVGMGALFPRFVYRNVVEVSLSFLGVVYMVLSMIYLLIVTFVLSLPVVRIILPDLLDLLPDAFEPLYLDAARLEDLRRNARFARRGLLLLLLSVAVFAVPLWLGARSLARREYR